MKKAIPEDTFSISEADRAARHVHVMCYVVL